MNYQCRWSKEQTSLAKDKQLGLFAVACNRAAGRFELTGLMPEARCALIWAFAQRLYTGMSPQEALDDAISAFTDEGRAKLGEPWRLGDIREPKDTTP